MKHALKYFSSRNVPSLRPNGVCFLTQSGKNIVLLKWKMTTMKNDVLSFTLHCCPITFSSARTNLCNIGMFRVPPVTYLLYQKVCEHFLISSPWKYQKTNLWALNFTQALTIRNCCLSIQLSSFHTLDFMSSQGTFYLSESESQCVYSLPTYKLFSQKMPRKLRNLTWRWIMYVQVNCNL